MLSLNSGELPKIHRRLKLFLFFIGATALLLNVFSRNVQDFVLVNSKWTYTQQIEIIEQKSRLEVSACFIKIKPILKIYTNYVIITISVELFDETFNLKCNY